VAQHYVPEAGDLVSISFDPYAGLEPAGHKPAEVLTRANNAKIGFNDLLPDNDADQKKSRISDAELAELLLANFLRAARLTAGV
jgi:hypothetical protein